MSRDKLPIIPVSEMQDVVDQNQSHEPVNRYKRKYHSRRCQISMTAEAKPSSIAAAAAIRA